MYLIGWPVQEAEARAGEIVETGSVTMGWAPPYECSGIYAIAVTDNDDDPEGIVRLVPLPYLAEVESFEAVGVGSENPKWKWKIRRFWSLPGSARVDATGSMGFVRTGRDFRDVCLALKKTPIEIAKA